MTVKHVTRPLCAERGASGTLANHLADHGQSNVGHAAVVLSQLTHWRIRVQSGRGSGDRVRSGCRGVGTGDLDDVHHSFRRLRGGQS